MDTKDPEHQPAFSEHGKRRNVINGSRNYQGHHNAKLNINRKVSPQDPRWKRSTLGPSQ